MHVSVMQKPFGSYLNCQRQKAWRNSGKRWRVGEVAGVLEVSSWSHSQDCSTVLNSDLAKGLMAGGLSLALGLVMFRGQERQQFNLGG